MSRIRKDIKTHDVFEASFGDPSNGVSALKHLKQQVVEVSLFPKVKLNQNLFYESISFRGIIGGSHELHAFLGQRNDLCGIWRRKGFQNHFH